MCRFLLQTVQLILLFSEVQSFIYLDKDLPCAQGISTIPPLDQLGFPTDRFPEYVPSGVGICDRTCSQSSQSVCTYNWADSIHGLPFLLFKCKCSNTCPPEKILYGGYLKILCTEVTSAKTRCICLDGVIAFRCTILVNPVQIMNPYYCVCCNSGLRDT